jgi:carboxypeptidase-like protein/TonB-dependent receptor-like protein
MKNLIYFYCLSIIFVQTLIAQNSNGLIRGFIKNAETNEFLAGANISVIGTSFGDAANENGFYEIILPEGTYTLKFDVIGYQPLDIKNLTLTPNYIEELNVYLIQEAMEYGETIEVVGKRDLSKEAVGSAISISSIEVEGRAGSLEDATRTMQTLPGVVTQTDFSGKMYVRGGKTQENVVLVDRIYVYEPYHLGGLSSIFNPDLIKDIEFYAGGFPAKYGQAMSSVIEVYNRYGERGKTKGSFSSSFVSTRFLTEGSLPGKKGSFLVSGRINYYDKIMDLLKLPSTYFRPHFYDYQLKLFYPLNKYHLFEINTLVSGDGYKMDVDKDNEFLDIPNESEKVQQQQNLSIYSIDWKWIISEKIYSHTNAAYIYNYFENRFTQPTTNKINFDVGNYDLRNETTFLNIPNHKIETGLYFHVPVVDYTISFPRSYWNLIYHTNQNSSVRLSDDSSMVNTNYKIDYQYMGFSMQDEWEIVTNKLKTNYGFRLEYLNVTEEILFNPRFSLVYYLYPHFSIKIATGIYSQYSRDPLVFDRIEGNLNIQAPYAIHYIGGIQKEFADGYLFRLESYYKDFNNLITSTLQNGYQNSGSGFSYGFDFFLQKEMGGNWDGWLTYSYSVSKRRDVQRQKLYFPIQDQRHTLSLVGNLKLSETWKSGIKWLFSSGKPYTSIAYVQEFTDPQSGDIIYYPIEGPINNKRFPNYSRLDIRIEKHFTLLGIEFDSYLEIINVFNSKNVYDYQYNQNYSDRETTHQLPRLPVLGISAIF